MIGVPSSCALMNTMSLCSFVSFLKGILGLATVEAFVSFGACTKLLVVWSRAWTHPSQLCYSLAGWICYLNITNGSWWLGRVDTLTTFGYNKVVISWGGSWHLYLSFNSGIKFCSHFVQKMNVLIVIIWWEPVTITLTLTALWLLKLWLLKQFSQCKCGGD